MWPLNKTKTRAGHRPFCLVVFHVQPAPLFQKFCADSTVASEIILKALCSTRGPRKHQRLFQLNSMALRMLLFYPNGAWNLKDSSSYWSRKRTTDVVSSKLKESLLTLTDRTVSVAVKLHMKNMRLLKVVIPKNFEQIHIFWNDYWLWVAPLRD